MSMGMQTQACRPWVCIPDVGQTRAVSSEDLSAWQANRREAAAEHAAAFERSRAAESQQAQQLIARFVDEAREHGLQPGPLKARSRTGGATYRTDITGWYLKRNGSVGVDTEGRFYVLSAPASLRSRFTGVTVTPSDPPLVVGVGGRDGESMPLDELLRLRLEAGDDWPSPS